MRQPIIAGNWKMNCTRAEATNLVTGLLPLIASNTTVQVVICPPFTALSTVQDLLAGTNVALGAQNVFWKESGAYTGEIAPRMLVDLGCKYVIVGHSEPRGRFGVAEPDFDEDILLYFGDSDTTVNRKLRAVLTTDMIPICCVGETLLERQEGRTDIVVEEQTLAALRDISAEDAAKLVFAYEPVWAIGTGHTCESHEANRVCGVIRETLSRRYNPEVGESVRIQYGGSVKPGNAAELLALPHIDGALVGGASLKAADFAAIAAAA